MKCPQKCTANFPNSWHCSSDYNMTTGSFVFISSSSWTHFITLQQYTPKIIRFCCDLIGNKRIIRMPQRLYSIKMVICLNSYFDRFVQKTTGKELDKVLRQSEWYVLSWNFIIHVETHEITVNLVHSKMQPIPGTTFQHLSGSFSSSLSVLIWSSITTAADCCCTQDNKREWRWNHFLIPKVLLLPVNSSRSEQNPASLGIYSSRNSGSASGCLVYSSPELLRPEPYLQFTMPLL